MTSLPTTTSSSFSLLNSALPKTASVLLATAAATSSTSLCQQKINTSENSSPENENDNKTMIPKSLPPRAKSCIYMAGAMAFNFGGYEFARSGALALFTSGSSGFSHPSAYPFAIGLTTPVSLVMLYFYGIILKAQGPRRALRLTKSISIAVLGSATLALKVLMMNVSSSPSPSLSMLIKALVAVLFVFQNSYAHLLYTQQWSFLGSVMTPSEGAKYFSAIAGLSSLLCTLTATLVHPLVSTIGLLGLMVGTCATLMVSLILADQAYELGEKVSTKVNATAICARVLLCIKHQTRPY